MTGAAFIQLAGELAAQAEPGEARFRTAVSRAYYGAFHLGLELLANLGVRAPRSGSKHFFVYASLQYSGDAAVREAGSLLSDLHGDRTKADYDLDDIEAGTRDFARVCVETADDVRRLLNGAVDEPRRGTIQAAIAEWRRKTNL